MNRREFHTAALGSLTVAALPMRAASAAAASTRGPLYAWAVAIAKAQNRASPALLAQQLKIPAVKASALYQILLSEGVIRAPLAGGLAKAVQPIKAPVVHSAPRTKITRDHMQTAWDYMTKEEEGSDIAEPPASSFQETPAGGQNSC